MSESQEPSYYEIALSNKQVVVFFVFVLLFVIAAFMCGVWVGRSGQERLIEKARLEGLAASRELIDQVPELSLETGTLQPTQGAANPPDLSSLGQKKPGSRTSTLIDDVEGRTPAPTPAPTYAEPADPEPAPSEPAPAPRVAERREPAPTPAPTRVDPPAETRSEPKPPADGAPGFVVQVFSTKDEAQAKKLLSDLKGAGHRAFLSPVKVGAQTMYRVRIGPFAQRGPAEQSAAKVKQKFRLEPWVTAAN